MKTTLQGIIAYTILSIAAVLYIFSWIWFFEPPFNLQVITDTYEKTFIWISFHLMFILGILLFSSDPKALSTSLGVYLIKCMVFSLVLIIVLSLPISVIWSLVLFFAFGFVLFAFRKEEDVNWQVHIAVTVALSVLVYVNQSGL